MGGGVVGKYEICKLMCNRLRTLRIGRYAPVIGQFLKSTYLEAYEM